MILENFTEQQATETMDELMEKRVVDLINTVARPPNRTEDEYRAQCQKAAKIFYRLIRETPDLKPLDMQAIVVGSLIFGVSVVGVVEAQIRAEIDRCCDDDGNIIHEGSIH